jgi:thioredoxin-dependent peroxiredoxin
MAKKTKAKKKAAPKPAKAGKKAKAKKATAKKSAKKRPAPKKKAVKKKKIVKKSAAKKPARRSGGKAAPQKKKGLAKKKVQVKKAVAKKAVKAVLKKKVVKKTVAAKPVEIMDTAKPVSLQKETSTNSSNGSNAGADTFKKHVTSLREGDPAPFFEGVDQNGNRITSLDFPGKNIVLFFYPEDDTETCTIEACNLRDEFKYLNDNNYAVVGVSPDSVDSHGKFADKYNLPYPLIADTDKKIIKAYDVWGPKQLFGRIYDGLVRTTFIIGFEGNIKKIITNVEAANHAKQIVAG